MNLSIPHQRRLGIARISRAFTLIELLVVIAIIAILAGLLLPVISNVMIKAKAVETKNTALQVVTGIKSYWSEYGAYPVAYAATPVDTTFLDTDSNAPLFKILQATNTDYAATGLNTRRQRYFEYKDAKSLTAPKAGFVPATAVSAKDNLRRAVVAGDLLDSFGNRFFIRMDSGYTDSVLNPYTETGTSPSSTANDTGAETDLTKVIRLGVVVWSYGNDGKIGKNGTKTDQGDDILTWQ